MSAEYSMMNETITRPLSCPRNAIDVYLLGVFIEDYLVNTLTELANKKPRNNNFITLVKSHVIRRDKMRELSKNCLNCSLAYFYANGGPIIEPPISEQYLIKVNPSFNRKIAKFSDQLNAILNIFARANNTEKAERELTNSIVELLARLNNLYQDAEIIEAFADLIRVETAALQK